MPLTATKLREDIYNILDNVIRTGESVDVERNGVILTIALAAQTREMPKLERLKLLPKRTQAEPLAMLPSPWAGMEAEVLSDWDEYEKLRASHAAKKKK